MPRWEIFLRVWQVSLSAPFFLQCFVSVFLSGAQDLRGMLKWQAPQWTEKAQTKTKIERCQNRHLYLSFPSSIVYQWPQLHLACTSLCCFSITTCTHQLGGINWKVPELHCTLRAEFTKGLRAFCVVPNGENGANRSNPSNHVQVAKCDANWDIRQNASQCAVFACIEMTYCAFIWLRNYPPRCNSASMINNVLFANASANSHTQFDWCK